METPVLPDVHDAPVTGAQDDEATASRARGPGPTRGDPRAEGILRSG